MEQMFLQKKHKGLCLDLQRIAMGFVNINELAIHYDRHGSWMHFLITQGIRQMVLQPVNLTYIARGISLIALQKTETFIISRTLSKFICCFSV